MSQSGDIAFATMGATNRLGGRNKEDDNMAGKEPLRDFSGRIIGWLEEDSLGNQTLRDFPGRILGRYEKSSNTTKDFYGRIVGRGNVLTMLLKDQ